MAELMFIAAALFFVAANYWWSDHWGISIILILIGGWLLGRGFSL